MDDSLASRMKDDTQRDMLASVLLLQLGYVWNRAATEWHAPELRQRATDSEPISKSYPPEVMARMSRDCFTQPGEQRHDDGTIQTHERMEADRAAAEHAVLSEAAQANAARTSGHVSSLLGPLGGG